MWQMSKLHLMDGIRPLMDGVTERGAMDLLSRLVQRLSALSRSARMQMLRLLAMRRQSLSARYLYPLMRMSLLVAILLLEALVRLVSRVRLMYRQVETQLQLVWDRLRSQEQPQYPQQEMRQRYRLELLRLLQAIRFQSVAQSLLRLRQALALMVTQLLELQVIQSQHLRLRRLFGVLSMTVKRQAGLGLVQVKRQTGRLLMIVKRLIGKR